MQHSVPHPVSRIELALVHLFPSLSMPATYVLFHTYMHVNGTTREKIEGEKEAAEERNLLWLAHPQIIDEQAREIECCHHHRAVLHAMPDYTASDTVQHSFYFLQCRDNREIQDDDRA